MRQLDSQHPRYKSNSTDGYFMKAPALFQTVPGTLLAIRKNLSLGQIYIGVTFSDPESIFYTVSTVKNDIQSLLVITMRVPGGHYTRNSWENNLLSNHLALIVPVFSRD